MTKNKQNMTTQTKTTWRKVKLGEVVSINPDSVGKDFSFDQIFYTDISSVDTGVADDPTEMSLSDAPSRARRLVKSGDTILSTVRPNRRSFLYMKNPEKNRVVSTGFAVLRAGEKVDSRFLYYLISNQPFTDYLTLHAKGAAYPAVDEDILANAEVVIPKVETQKQIADVLSAYDDLIENNTRRIQILEQIAQAIYREWFSEGKGEIAKLENCFSIQRGKSYRSDELSDDGGVPFVNLKCIDRDGGFRKSGLKKFIGTFKELQKVVAGDIVVAITDMTQERRIVAHAARIPTLEGGFGVVSMDLVKLQPKENCDLDYLYCLLRWSGFSDEVKNHANGANVLHLNPARITDYKTTVASPEKQKEFGKKVRPLFDLIDRLELQNESLRPARDLLLPKLVNGELEIKQKLLVCGLY